jgi:hypothetical protein
VSRALSLVFPTADRIEAVGSDDAAHFAAFRGGERLGYALWSSGGGFYGPVFTLLGIDAAATTIRVEYTSSVGPEWIWALDASFFDQFRCLDTARLDVDARDWGPYEVDAVTGATYTSRGVIDSVWASLERYRRYLAE